MMARNALKTPEQIRIKLKKLLEDIEAGNFEGKLAEARLMVTILDTMLKSIRTDELQKQLDAIEERLEEQEDK